MYKWWRISITARGDVVYRECEQEEDDDAGYRLDNHGCMYV